MNNYRTPAQRRIDAEIAQRAAAERAQHEADEAERLAAEQERRAQNDRLRDARLAKLAANREAQDTAAAAARQKEQEAAEQAMIARLRSTWPGTDATFEAALPQLMAQLVAERAAANRSEYERRLRNDYAL